MHEVAMSGCEFGCKVYRCEHGNLLVIHSETYGHREPSIQRSSTGARCTCPEGVA